jgi:hypothetical protein
MQLVVGIIARVVLHVQVASLLVQVVVADGGKVGRASDGRGRSQVFDGAIVGEVKGGGAMGARVGADGAVGKGIVVAVGPGLVDGRGQDGGAGARGIQRELAGQSGAGEGRVARGGRRSVWEGSGRGRVYARRGQRDEDGRRGPGGAVDKSVSGSVSGSLAGGLPRRIAGGRDGGAQAAVEATEAAGMGRVSGGLEGGQAGGGSGEVVEGRQGAGARGRGMQLVERVVQRAPRGAGHGGGEGGGRAAGGSMGRHADKQTSRHADEPVSRAVAVGTKYQEA